LQALSLLKKAKVDLLITDIRMPQMDGLTLLHQVRELYPNIHCILLTAFSEFEYAREALLLGVENYLLKPFLQEELETTIEKALDNVSSNRSNDAQLFRANLLTRWVTGSINSDEFSERAMLLDLNIYLKEYCVLVCRKRNKCSLSAYKDYFVKKLGNALTVQAFWNKDCYVLVVGGASIHAEVLITVLTDCSKELGIQEHFLVSVGSVVQGNDNVPQSYRLAYELLETTPDMITGPVITLSETLQAFQDSLSQGLDALFHIEDSKLRLSGYRQFTQKLLTKSNDTDVIYAALTHSLFRLFEQEFPEEPDIHPQLSSRIHLSKSSSLDTLENTIMELLEYSYLLFRYYFEQLSPVIQHAVGYIQRHYADSLSVKEFCVKNKMNTAYLGYLFKKETGMFFNNYLAQYRICCSLRLLENTEMQIGEIAEAVGFSSPSYFISCFRKQLGLSPIKYRSLRYTTGKDIHA
jgi:two-component system response regulator YesN